MDIVDTKEVSGIVVEWIRMMSTASEIKFMIAGCVMIIILGMICYTWYRVKTAMLNSQTQFSNTIPLEAFTAMINEQIENVRALTETITAQVEMVHSQSEKTAELTMQIATIVDHVKDVKDEMARHRFCPISHDTI